MPAALIFFRNESLIPGSRAASCWENKVGGYSEGGP